MIAKGVAESPFSGMGGGGLWFVEGCKFFNPFVMFYDSVTKQVRYSYDYSRDA